MSSTDPPQGQNVATSSELYLYTFLSTLVLLLCVSAAVVARSLILRRRHRRMIEEAIQNGTWPPPALFPGRVPKKNTGEKPKMFAASLLFDEGEGKQKQKEEWGFGTDVGWEEMLPLAASYLKLTTTGQPQNDDTQAPPRLHPPLPRRNTFQQYLGIRSAPAQLPPPAPTPPSLERKPSTMEILVLVAMPSQHHPRTCQYEGEGGLPHLEFGVTTAHVESKEAITEAEGEAEGASQMV